MAATLLTEGELERDRRLVHQHQAGDTTAFGELYELHFARLVRFCHRKVGDPHLAEELAQESFLKAYGSLSTFDGDRRFYPWLTVIATRLVIDHQRRSGRVRPEPVIDLGTVDDAQDDLVREVERDHVRLALERVRGRHREVLHLRDWEDLSYDAIAQRLGTTPTIVQSLLHRARLAVRREYLALSETAALLPVLGPVLALLRRLRLRTARATAWLPDAASLSVPLAAGALAVGSALGVTAPIDAMHVSPPAAAPMEFVRPAAGPALPAPQSTSTVPAPVTDHAAIAPSQDTPAPPVAEMWLGPEGAAHARERSADMPTQVDAGAAFLGMDPPAAVDDTQAAVTELTRSIDALLGGS